MSDDLDDILNSALDDIEADDVDARAEVEVDLSAAAKAAAEASAQGAEKGAVTADVSNLENDMSKLFEDMENPEFAKALEETFAALSMGGEAGGANPLLAALAGDGAAAQGAAGAGGEQGGEEVDEELMKTLKNLADMSKDMEGADPAQAEKMGEDLLNGLLSSLEKAGQKEDFEEMVNGLMKQMLSKDILYEPMKKICEKFPEWLAENESKLSTEDYERYGNQYQSYQKIIAVYETDEHNSARISELMQDMQEFGSPPSDLVKDLAPGLEFGADGMPVMPNMGPGVVPPGMEGMDPSQGCPQQ